MNLFDSLRPKLPNSRPTWLRDHIAIPHFEVFPLKNNELEISIWLPIKDSIFSSMRFTKILSQADFLNLLNDFIENPEETCEKLFQNSRSLDHLKPELRTNVRYEETNLEEEGTNQVAIRNRKIKKPIILSNLEF